MIDVLTKDFQQEDLKELDKKGFEDYKKLNIYLSFDKKISMIPLTYDKMFKALFVKCQEEFKDFLIETLNLDLRTEDITINILNNEVAIDNYNEVKKIADLFIKINDNILLNIEVNRKSYNDVKLRNNRYIGKLIDGQIYSESDYKKLNDVLIIQLNINSAEKSKEGKEKEIVMYDKKSCKIFSENLKIFLKYVENYRELYYNGDRKRETIWYAFLASRTYTECYSILLNLFEEERARKVMEEVIRLNSNIYLMSELEEERYNELAFISATNHAKEEGKEEGIKQGKEEGKKEGIKQGKEKTVKELIKNMLNENMDINIISKIANVSIDRINEIRKEIYN